MIMTLPRRRMTRQLAHLFLTDVDTFIFALPNPRVTTTKRPVFKATGAAAPDAASGAFPGSIGEAVGDPSPPQVVG